MGKSGKAGDQKQKCADYFMSLHIGVCWGPVDKVLRVFIGEKEAWEGSVTSNTTINVHDKDLFGGTDKEGGIGGKIEFLLGGALQTLNNGIASRFGLTSLTSPGYRGLFSLFFYDGKGQLKNTAKGFYWSTNSPYIKPQWVQVFRKSPGLNAAFATIPNTVIIPAHEEEPEDPDDDPVEVPEESYIVDDVNPANIIYECLTNTDWGMGASNTMLDIAAFEAAQEALFDEEFGMSMQWVKQARIEDFVSEVLDHINGTVFVNPQTGLLTLKLIRDDYDPDTLLVANPNNCQVTSFQRKLWGETVNEIIVTWTNPSNEEEETITSQDLANIAMQGGIVSDPRNFYGARNANLAKRLADRECRIASSPLVAVEAILDRSFWRILPGGCIKLTWPEQGVTELIMRVMKVDYGKPGDSKIKASLIEDIFSLGVAQFVTPAKGEWVDPSQDPQEFTQVKFMTMPWAVLEAEVGAPQAELLVYPEVATIVLAGFPNDDTYQYSLMAEEPDPLGVLDYVSQGTLRPVSYGNIPAPLVFEAQSVMAFPNLKGPDEPTLGGFVVFGNVNTPDNQTEIAQILSGDALVGWTVRRGVLDTLPRPWAAGTKAWFFTVDDPVTDNTIRAAGAAVAFKLLPKTSFGGLSVDDVDPISFTPSDRPYLPIRPANVLIAGSNYANVDISDTVMTVGTSWAHRNRFQESAPLQAYDAVSISPELGQTTTVRISEVVGDALIIEETGLSATSYDIPIADFGEYPRVRVTVTAARGVYESFQPMSVIVNFEERLGYGMSYGYNYGGAH